MPPPLWLQPHSWSTAGAWLEHGWSTPDELVDIHVHQLEHECQPASGLIIQHLQQLDDVGVGAQPPQRLRAAMRGVLGGAGRQLSRRSSRAQPCGGLRRLHCCPTMLCTATSHGPRGLQHHHAPLHAGHQAGAARVPWSCLGPAPD